MTIKKYLIYFEKSIAFFKIKVYNYIKEVREWRSIKKGKKNKRHARHDGQNHYTSVSFKRNPKAISLGVSPNILYAFSEIMSIILILILSTNAYSLFKTKKTMNRALSVLNIILSIILLARGFK